MFRSCPLIRLACAPVRLFEVPQGTAYLFFIIQPLAFKPFEGLVTFRVQTHTTPKPFQECHQLGAGSLSWFRGPQ